MITEAWDWTCFRQFFFGVGGSDGCPERSRSFCVHSAHLASACIKEFRSLARQVELAASCPKRWPSSSTVGGTLRLGSNVPWLCECAPKACATWVNASVRECPQICGIRSIYRINVLCHETETLSTRPSCMSRRRHRKEGAKSILLSARLCELSWHPSVSERSADSVFFSLGLLFLSLSLFAFFDCSFLFFRRFLDSGLWRQAFTKPLFPDAWQVTGRRSYNVSGTPDKLLDEDLTTYQERRTSFWTKILQRIKNAWQVTGRRCSDQNATTYQDIVIDTAGHRTLLHPPNPPKNLPPKTSPWKNDKILARFSTRRLKHAMPVMTALPCSSLVCLSIECHKEEQRDKGSKKVQGIRPNI